MIQASSVVNSLDANVIFQQFRIFLSFIENSFNYLLKKSIRTDLAKTDKKLYLVYFIKP